MNRLLPRSLLPDLSRRIFVPELMDAPDCDEWRLAKSYVELAHINRWLSRARGLLERYVLADVEARGQPARFVDVGCGGGDLLAWLAQRVRARGLPLELVGVDVDPRAVRLAQARLRPWPVQVLPGSALALDRLGLQFDYVFCNHVLHHFPDDEVVPVLRALGRAARRRLLVNDLARSAWSYAGYTALAAVAFHGSYTFHDGRLSIRKGFRPEELAAAARAAGLPQARVSTLPPGRVVLIADRS